jgi:hypothetical protein
MRTLVILVIFGQINLTIGQEKNDSLLKIELTTINMEDIVDALNLTGVEIFKFNTGEFDKKLEFTLLLEEFVADTLKLERILFTGKNWQTIYDENNQPIEKFINTIRIISHKDESECKLSIDLKGTTLNRQFSVNKTYNRQFFKWIKYSDTNWTLNKKIPLMTYISSWQDEKGYIRFCGLRVLNDGDKDMNRYFSLSPNYFILSYKVNEIKENKGKK